MLYLLLVLGIVSCSEDSTKDVLIQKEDTRILETEDEKFTSKVTLEKLHVEAVKITKDWQEYQAVLAFIPKFYKTSTKEILLNSNQFYELTTFLKDSIRLKQFNKPSIKSRLNVLHNESLRLFDMDSIPNITNKEVIVKTMNIINAFNAINSKINNEVKRGLLTKDLLGFNIEPVFENDIEPNTQNNISKKRPKLNNALLKKMEIRKGLKNKRIKPLSVNKKKK